ncbi:MAG: hypothetical protein GY808_14105 [Gammaproteobacteria bacterium]|nr:hypothetical protein [Gammaproteobacteria bacterium]
MRLRKSCIILAILFGVLCTASVSLATNRAIWIEGEVTHSPMRVGSHYTIEVDGIFYKILPDIRITYRYLRNEGAYNEKNINIDSISTGKKIMMKVRKENVIQIILF